MLIPSYQAEVSSRSDGDLKGGSVGTGLRIQMSLTGGLVCSTFKGMYLSRHMLIPSYQAEAPTMMGILQYRHFQSLKRRSGTDASFFSGHSLMVPFNVLRISSHYLKAGGGSTLDPVLVRVFTSGKV
jgi:hypothetical protein